MASAYAGLPYAAAPFATYAAAPFAAPIAAPIAAAPAPLLAKPVVAAAPVAKAVDYYVSSVIESFTI